MKSCNSGSHLRCPQGRYLHPFAQEKELPQGLLEGLNLNQLSAGKDVLTWAQGLPHRGLEAHPATAFSSFKIVTGA